MPSSVVSIQLNSFFQAVLTPLARCLDNEPDDEDSDSRASFRRLTTMLLRSQTATFRFKPLTDKLDIDSASSAANASSRSGQSPLYHLTQSHPYLH